ncbi:MAG: hypothetical protein U1E60_22365 [Reyranellaceae bacterium]
MRGPQCSGSDIEKPDRWRCRPGSSSQRKGEIAAEEAFEQGFYGGVFAKCDRLGVDLVIMQLASGEIPSHERTHAYEWLRRKHAIRHRRESLRNNVSLALSIIAVVIAAGTFFLKTL